MPEALTSSEPLCLVIWTTTNRGKDTIHFVIEFIMFKPTVVVFSSAASWFGAGFNCSTLFQLNYRLTLTYISPIQPVFLYGIQSLVVICMVIVAA